MTQGNLKLRDILILFDRDFGLSIFENFRGYDSPIDDAEWILERNPKTKGFILRPVTNVSEKGLWVGEYTPHGSSITRYEVLNGKGALQSSRLISNYIDRKITEREIAEKLNLKWLKKKLESDIIRDFRYYECPSNHFYNMCDEVERVYESLRMRYGSRRVPYGEIADEISATVRCSDAIICPLKASNAFERIHSLNRALKSRRIGEIRIVSPGIVQLV